MKITRQRIVFVVQLLVGLMLLGTGISKALTAQDFLQSFQAYQAIPDALAPAASFLVILAELALGALLVVSLQIRWASILATLMFIVFTIAIAIAWWRGLTIDCGCFLGVHRSVGPEAIIEDLIFIFMSGWISWEHWSGSSRSAEPAA